MGAIYSCCFWGFDGSDLGEKNAILRHDACPYQELPAPVMTRASLARASLSRSPPTTVTCRPSLSHELMQDSDTDFNRTMWGTPRSSTGNTESESDGELQAFIELRNQTDQATEEWEKLNYDIHTLKCARREVSTRWKKILLLLGYQKEVDFLLSVNRQTALLEAENLDKARELLQTIWEESGLFPPGIAANDRYIFVMDRLISLDSAEEFVRLAKEKYPRAYED